MHSKEVAYLSGMLADELRIDPTMAKRAGLFHDIGKAATHEVEGSHVQIGYDIAKRYNEPPEVLNAIVSHHEDEEANCIESVLVKAADTLSAARPGARREMVESYIKRLEALEKIAESFNGVEKCFAIQGGAGDSRVRPARGGHRLAGHLPGARHRQENRERTHVSGRDTRHRHS